MDFGGRVAVTRFDGLGPGRLGLGDEFRTLLSRGRGCPYRFHHERMGSYAATFCSGSSELLYVVRKFQ